MTWTRERTGLYVSGDYRIEHVLGWSLPWRLTRPGGRTSDHNSLADAKRSAEEHRRQGVTP